MNRRILFHPVVLTCGLLCTSSLAVGQAPNLPPLELSELDLLNQTPKIWVAPNRLFSVHLPHGWQVYTFEKDPYSYELKTRFAPSSFLQIKRILVPSGAAPQHVMRNDIERYLSGFPMYETLLEQRSARMAGYKASSLQFRYAFQGNVQYRRFVQRIYMVVGEEAFIIHFEAPEGRAKSMETALQKIQASFIVRPPGSVEDPFAAPEDPLDVDALPF